MAAELGQQTVEFSALVRRAAVESYLSLKELVERSKVMEERSDSEKKIDLLKFIVKTRQRMLRLHVLAKWCRQVSFPPRADRSLGFPGDLCLCSVCFALVHQEVGFLIRPAFEFDC